MNKHAANGRGRTDRPTQCQPAAVVMARHNTAADINAADRLAENKSALRQGSSRGDQRRRFRIAADDATVDRCGTEGTGCQDAPTSVARATMDIASDGH